MKCSMAGFAEPNKFDSSVAKEELTPKLQRKIISRVYCIHKNQLMKVSKRLSISLLGMLISALSFGQSADEIINKHLEAIGGKENWKKVNSIRQEASISIQGMEIPVITTTVHNKATKQEYTAMGMSAYSIITSEGGWSFNPMQGQAEPEAINEEQLKYGKYQLDAQGEFIDYKEKGHAIEKIENEDVDGISCFRLKINRKEGTSTIF